MIKKDALLDGLVQLRALEDALSPYLNQHVPASLAFSRLKSTEKVALVAYLKRQSIVQKKHAQILGDLKREVEESTNDVF